MRRISRRSLLLAGGLSGLAYSLYRGVRYPRLSLDPLPAAREVELGSSEIAWDGFIQIESDPEKTSLALRAYAAEPRLSIRMDAKTELKLRLNNISPKAELHIQPVEARRVTERIDGISREIKIDLQQAETIELSWRYPQVDAYKFAILGDTGGALELGWALNRATQLEADFLLHLGDLNYAPGEYDSAIKQLEQAPIPVYTSIGNHDFHHKGLIHREFRQRIGPLNFSFQLGKVHFCNIDTAADYLPAFSGHRARVLDQLATRADDEEVVLFTHRGLYDPRKGKDHDVGGLGEKNWLLNKYKALGIKNIFNGHVHHSDETDLEGVRQWTVGEGLGYEDILARKQIASLLIGDVMPGTSIAYTWHPLDMPWSLHQSPTHRQKMIRNNRLEELKWYEDLMRSISNKRSD